MRSYNELNTEPSYGGGHITQNHLMEVVTLHRTILWRWSHYMYYLNKDTQKALANFLQSTLEVIQRNIIALDDQ